MFCKWFPYTAEKIAHVSDVWQSHHGWYIVTLIKWSQKIYLPLIIRQRNSFVCPFKWSITATQFIFNTKHSRIKLNNIFWKMHGRVYLCRVRLTSKSRRNAASFWAPFSFVKSLINFPYLKVINNTNIISRSNLNESTYTLSNSFCLSSLYILEIYFVHTAPHQWSRSSEPRNL